MKKLLILLLTFFSLHSFSQKQIKHYVQKNLTVIRTIDPDSTDFTELESIGNAIGDSRIVMLGEQDHGDAPTFLAKTRLIKYLHQQKGFNVLAFESDFFSLNEGWDNLNKNKSDVDAFLSGNIFSIWTKCVQCDDLFYNYLSKNAGGKTPIMVTGFDCQSHGAYGKKNLKIFVDSLLRSKQLPFTKSTSYKTTFLPFIDSVKVSKDITKSRLFINQIDTILNQLPNESTSSFEMMVLFNLKENCRSSLSFLQKGPDYLEIRDHQMAENLKWLMDKKYPNEKIIVWAHNGHISKDYDSSKIPGINFTPMGYYLAADPGFVKKTYVLGFDSKYGTAGRITMPKTYKVELPRKNSFENWLPDQVKYAFLDFKKFNLENPQETKSFSMKGKGHSPSDGVWNKIFDGIFYIRDMYPCEKSTLKF